MTEKQFLEQLDAGLKQLSAEERKDILQDYKEHFAMGKEEGKMEEAIAEALGSPTKIAKELLATYHLEKAEEHTTAGNVLRAVWAGIGLGFFNLVIVLGPFMALVGIVAAGWVTGLAFTLSPILELINIILYPGSFVSFELFFCFVLAGAGLFILIGMYYVTKIVTQFFVRYLKWNVSFVKGGMTNA